MEEIISFSLFFRFPLFVYDRFDKVKVVATDDEVDPKKLQITEKYCKFCYSFCEHILYDINRNKK